MNYYPSQAYVPPQGQAQHLQQQPQQQQQQPQQPQQPNPQYVTVAVPYHPVGAVAPGLAPLAPGVFHSEPVVVSTGMKVNVGVTLLLIAGLVGLNYYLIRCTNEYEYNYSFRYFWFIYSIFLFLLVGLTIMYRWPRRVDLTTSAVVLYTRWTSYSIPYERIAVVSMVPSVCCWFGHFCKFPKGAFTSFSNGIFFNSNDCGQSLCFSPQNIDRFTQAIAQTTPLRNRMVVA